MIGTDMTHGQDPAFLRESVLEALDKILDPCSVGISRPIGLVGMGIVHTVDVQEGSVHVLILPTFPNCMFRGVIEDNVKKKLISLPWCHSVTVEFCSADTVWDETRMSNEALRILGRKVKRASDRSEHTI